jgi:signal transduction histidine kinase
VKTSDDLVGYTRVESGGALDDLALRELRHDLRQPLATVRLLADVVSATEGLPPEAVGALDRIQQQTDWMFELLRSAEFDLPEISVVDLADVVEGPCLATPEGVPYDVSFAKEDRTDVLVDPVGLKRSAWNLMDNARRAVATGGTVEVLVSRHRRDAVLEVADSGPGFGRMPTQSGHGLVGVRRFAERFGGDLRVGVSSLGGALVTLRLPLALGQPASCGR